MPSIALPPLWLRPIVATWILSLLLMSVNLAAQSLSLVSAQVVDETGGALPGATVVLRDAAKGQERTLVTDAAGRFSTSLLPGSYSVTISLSGFDTFSREALEVSEGRTVNERFVLKVSSLTDSVVVRGTALNYASAIAGKRTADGVVDMFN